MKIPPLFKTFYASGRTDKYFGKDNARFGKRYICFYAVEQRLLKNVLSVASSKSFQLFPFTCCTVGE